MTNQFRFSIDRGGTFCDVYCEYDVNGKRGSKVTKLLSVDPDNYPDAPTEGIRRILDEVSDKSYPAGSPIDTSEIEWIRCGTTVATNALLEREGERVLLLITKGFRDALEIGNQSRPDIFDLQIVKPDVLYERVVEVDERVQLISEAERASSEGQSDRQFKQGVTGEWVEVLQAPDLSKIRPVLEQALQDGIKSVAVVCLHSFVYGDHEQSLAALAREVGFQHVSSSSELTRMARIVPRGLTACVDAYLTPVLSDYMKSFYSGFDDGITSRVQVQFMQSDGGLTPAASFSGYRAILSGPAGGVVGYAVTTYNKETQQPVIGFDMGGTSTDVSRYHGSYEHVYETQTAGVTIQAPQLDISTVAAGGGSRLFFENGMFVVGPQSAGAHPGPVCYRKKGGLLAVTDANLFLGRLPPDLFPKIFGPNEDQPLDTEGSADAFTALTKEVNAFYTARGVPPLSADDVAAGFIRVANEAMCRPIRALAQGKGHDTSAHVLACFGGAGGQHACAIARALGMSTVFVHRHSGILSAYGLGLADVVYEAQEPCAIEYSSETLPELEARIEALSAQAVAELKRQGFSQDHIKTEPFLHIRYAGTDVATMTPRPDDGDFASAFEVRYRQMYGFNLQGRGLVVDDVRVRGIGRTEMDGALPAKPSASSGAPTPHSHMDTFFDGGRRKTPVYMWNDLPPGTELAGPALVINNTSTVVVEPDSTVLMTDAGDLKITIGSGDHGPIGPELDAIQLSIFAHRFMSIAEQMGRTLQRTSISTNIKERLDFSCALFSPDGGLVANAPHIPVHLGAMGEAVRHQVELNKDNLEEGDVLVTNHPAYGGSHLPDITVVTPVFSDGKIVFFVANRGHHADIGGITPGSMPPFSTSLGDEGACIKSFKLVKAGEFQEAGITSILVDFPKTLDRDADAPPVAGTRNLADNISDLRAQVAANTTGIRLVGELIEQYGLHVVQAYMSHVQDAAETAVTAMLRKISVERNLPERGTLSATDYMDDGTPVSLALTIDRSDGSAIFDFTGTGPEVWGNTNAPRAITASAIVYCLRSLVDNADTPLNQGFLAKIKIIVPEGSLLAPSENAAVVGGNVLTSMRVTDVILEAFGAAANSQGCLNNITFGTETLGYYETLAGGAGAGPGWHGASGVHSHMSNTRITDPEILERRYPVLLREFSLRTDSGGSGEYKGGQGVVRELEFRSKMQFSILSERRALAPRGLNGGGPGGRGLNILFRHDGHVKNIGSKNSIKVGPGDRVRVCTPGGGGYGKATN